MSRNKKRVVQNFYLMLVYLWFCISVITSFHSSDLILLAHEKNIKHRFVGGGTSAHTDYELLKPYLISTKNQIQNPEEYKYIYNGHFTFDKALQIVQMTGDKHIICNIPVGHIAGILTTDQANQVAKDHNLQALSRKSLAEKQKAIKSHICTKSCSQCVTIFKAVNINKRDLKKQSDNKKKNRTKTKSQPKRYWEKPKWTKVNHKYYTKNNARFPPSPPSNHLMHKIITGFCNDTHPSKFEEAGCAICGQLVVMSDLIELANVKCSLDPLVHVGMTRLPRKSAEDPIEEIQGLILDKNCKHACCNCISYIENKTMPPTALANGFWVGDVPKVLSDLTFVERLLVSHVRSNRCIIHVLKGGWKIRANAIMFPTPIPKVCNILPPPIEELDEVIAFMFTGIARPTLEDTK